MILAGHLGKSVEWIRQNITSAELANWQLFHSHYPIGYKQYWYGIARICNTVRQMNGEHPIDSHEYIPRFEKVSQPESYSEEELKEQGKRMCRAFGGVIIENGKRIPTD